MAKLVKEKKVKIITQQDLDKFEDRCKYYAEEVKQYTKQTKFIKNCRDFYVGKVPAGKRPWNDEEKRLKLEILDKHFPGTKNKFIEYEKDEIQSLASRAKHREEKERLRERESSN